MDDRNAHSLRDATGASKVEEVARLAVSLLAEHDISHVVYQDTRDAVQKEK